MKKTLIALSVFAGLTGVAQADTTTLYGRVGYAVNFDDAAKVGSKTAIALQESNIRLGIKGDEQLNNGLEAFYQLEFDYKLDAKNDKDESLGDRLSAIREAKVGLRGAFGQIAFGKMSTLRGAWLAKADDFVSLSGNGWNANRLGRVINYTTPAGNGVTFGMSAILDGRDEGNGLSHTIGGGRRNVNAAEAGIHYAMNGIEAGVVYTRTSRIADPIPAALFGERESAISASGVFKPNTSEALGASIGHSNDVYSVGFDYEHRAAQGNYYALGGEYFLDPTNTFRAGVEVFDPSGTGAKHNPKNQYRAFLGYQYNFSKRTFAWVEAAYNRDEGAEFDAGANKWKKQSGYTAVVGIRHNF